MVPASARTTSTIHGWSKRSHTPVSRYCADFQSSSVSRRRRRRSANPRRPHRLLGRACGAVARPARARPWSSRAPARDTRRDRRTGRRSASECSAWWNGANGRCVDTRWSKLHDSKPAARTNAGGSQSNLRARRAPARRRWWPRSARPFRRRPRRTRRTRPTSPASSTSATRASSRVASTATANSGVRNGLASVPSSRWKAHQASRSALTELTRAQDPHLHQQSPVVGPFPAVAAKAAEPPTALTCSADYRPPDSRLLSAASGRARARGGR